MADISVTCLEDRTNYKEYTTTIKGDLVRIRLFGTRSKKTALQRIQAVLKGLTTNTVVIKPQVSIEP